MYYRYTPYTDIGKFAEHIGMEEGNLKKILVTQKYAFTGLDKADRILLGLGLTITQLEMRGEITVVPSAKANSAKKMADDMERTKLEELRPMGNHAHVGRFLDQAPIEEVRAWGLRDSALLHGFDRDVFIESLKTTREVVCAPTIEQRAVLERDKARIKAAKAAKASVAA